jgi:hypothetical protein
MVAALRRRTCDPMGKHRTQYHPQQKIDSTGNAPETVVLCHLASKNFVTGRRCIVGDLISHQNDGKGWLVIPDETEQTVSEHASQRINIRAGNALNTQKSEIL